MESISLEEFIFVLLFPSDKFKLLFWFFKDKLVLGFILEDEFWHSHKFLPPFIYMMRLFYSFKKLTKHLY